MAISSEYEGAYPRELWGHERELLAARRGASLADAERPPHDMLGVALSGGGIRSATFSLGVFQALARFGLVARIDYLSTVSGGGYFGACLGRLFSRPEIHSAREVEHLLSGAPGSAGPPAMPDVVRWLRENGRYMSPNGAGDLLQAGAGLLRNWVAIQVVLLSFFVMLFLTGQMLRGLVAVSHPDWSAAYAAALEWYLPGRALVWWSPYISLWLVPFVVGALPLGWAYWMIGRVGARGRFYERPVTGLVVSVVLTLMLAAGAARPVWRGMAWTLLGIEVLTAIVWAAAYGSAVRRARTLEAREAFKAESDPQRAAMIFKDDESRHTLSAWLKVALVMSAVALAFALIDTVSQTAYLDVVTQQRPNLPVWTGTLLSVLAALAGFARKIAVIFSGRVGGKRPSLPVSFVATTLALLIAALLLVLTDAVSHAIVWSFKVPGAAPWYWWEGLPASQVSQHQTVSDLHGPGLIWLATALFSLLFGWCWPFLNGSSQLSLYSARLTRAYLGASNPLRVDPTNQKITRVLPGDNTDLANYYPGHGGWGADKVPPLHLINVTINETVDGKSQIEQRDRKGIGLAIGPRSFSAGIQHHAVFASHRREDRKNARIFPAASNSAGSSPPFQMFWRWSGGEELSLGYWVGISGAAFSTGIGARTNLGLSMLCGLSNVRLGYWWDSHVEPSRRPQWAPSLRQRLAASLTRWVFLVQTCLLDELLARFPGSAARRWYLSDGGHFENLGGYELIRRRLPRILVIDAEADPEYKFEGLANLVRKARLDFGAEITFLTGPELDATVDPAFRKFFGTLPQLRRGKWSGALARSEAGGGLELDVVDLERHSLAHAALARIVYEDEPERVSHLVYVKPTLTGDEPADITHYHGAHSSFPQEPTSDQYFDEAQWESYRRLGFEIASDLFHAAAARSEKPGEGGGKLTPRDFLFGA
ncbi:MAG TPA: hypothetical protein VGT00_08795 [Methylomirabilota bacterium]|nr:hypothetical protein [Methylomirabilota bacterium]